MMLAAANATPRRLGWNRGLVQRIPDEYVMFRFACRAVSVAVFSTFACAVHAANTPNLRLYMQTVSESQWLKFAKTAELRPPMPW